jgi:ribosomal protein S14
MDALEDEPWPYPEQRGTMCPWTDDRKRSDTSRAWARNSIDATPPAVVRDLNTCRYFVRSQRYVDHEDATFAGHVAGDDLSAVGRDRLPSNGQPKT